jgi:hypothetical protein
MGWKITQDHLESRGWANYQSEKGRESKSSEYKGGSYWVRTFDDDGTLYYTAKCDGEASAEAFHDWSSYDSGTVRSQVKKKWTDKWEEFIS